MQTRTIVAHAASTACLPLLPSLAQATACPEVKRKQPILRTVTVSLVALATLLVARSSAMAQTMGPTLADQCVSTHEGSRDNGRAILLWDCHDGPDQRWEVREGVLRNPNFDRCLSLRDGVVAPGREAILFDCHDGADQVWHVTSDGTLQNEADPTICLSTHGGSLARNTPLVAWSCHGLPDQRWLASSADPIVGLPDFRITNIVRSGSGLLLTIHNSGPVDGTVRRIECSGAGRGKVVTGIFSVPAGSDGLAFVRLDLPAGVRATCRVTGEQKFPPRLPETVTFNNTLVMHVF